MENPREKPHRDYHYWWSVVLTALFCLALASPTIAVLAGNQSTFAVTERRDPAPFPGWPTNAAELKSFPKKCEPFVNDNFGLRSQLVVANNYTRFLIGVSGSKSVLVGRDGWLYLGAENVVNDFRAIKPPKTRYVDRWFNQMNQRLEFLNRHGIRMLVVVAPNKHTIYPEYMPRYVTRSDNPSALDTLLTLAPSRAPDLEILDLRPALFGQKARHRLYHMTDSHWSALGAFHGYEAIVEVLQDDFPTIGKLELADFDLVERETPGLGNARMLGIANFLVEEGQFLNLREDSRIIERNTLDDFRPLNTQIITTSLPDAPSLFILGDSFLQAPLVYLEQSFSKTVVVDRRGRGFDREFILQESPDLVIFETVQRNLFQQPRRE